MDSGTHKTQDVHFEHALQLAQSNYTKNMAMENSENCHGCSLISKV